MIVEERKQGKLYAGLLGLVGGEVEPDESRPDAAVRAVAAAAPGASARAAAAAGDVGGGGDQRLLPRTVRNERCAISTRSQRHGWTRRRGGNEGRRPGELAWRHGCRLSHVRVGNKHHCSRCGSFSCHPTSKLLSFKALNLRSHSAPGTPEVGACSLLKAARPEFQVLPASGR